MSDPVYGIPVEALPPLVTRSNPKRYVMQMWNLDEGKLYQYDDQQRCWLEIVEVTERRKNFILREPNEP